MAQYYKELECPDYQIINQGIMSWIDQRDIIKNTDFFWNPVDTLDFMRSNPAFSKWCHSHDLKIQQIVVTVLKDGMPLLRPHTDTPPARFKLSWPVLNADTTWNRWFDINGDFADTVVNAYQGTSFTDINQLREVDRRKLLGPALIDASCIHDVEIGQDQRYPRIGLQCQLFNEPKNL